MLNLFRNSGKFKTPVKAYRTHGSEFMLYETDFGDFKWEDMFANRICIVCAPPSSRVQQHLQVLLDDEFQGYIIVDVQV
jgi:hypothetical protein